MLRVIRQSEHATLTHTQLLIGTSKALLAAGGSSICARRSEAAGCRASSGARAKAALPRSGGGGARPHSASVGKP